MQLSRALRRALLAFTVSTTIIATGLSLCAKAQAEDASSAAGGLLSLLEGAYPQYSAPVSPHIHPLADSKAMAARCGAGIYACAAMTVDGTCHVFVAAHRDYAEPEPSAALLHELFHCVQWSNGRLPDRVPWRVLENEARKAERLVDRRIRR